MFMEILEWFDETGEELVHRLPAEGSAAFELGSQLIVRESQEAIFYNGGQVRDRFGPGRHTLSTKNLPLVNAALSLPWGFNSPFRCEVYFVNKKVFTNLKWGTREPVVFADTRLGLVRLRAHGQVSFRVSDPLVCIHDLVGTRASFGTHDATDHLRDVIVSRLREHLGETLTTVFELPASYDEMGEHLARRLAGDFGKYGLELVDFFVTSVTPPEEVQSMVDGQGGLRLVPDLPAYLQYRAARSLGGAPAEGSNGHGGSYANAGMIDAGVGLGVGLMLPQMLAVQAQPRAVSPGAHPELAGRTAAGFCTACGTPLRGGDRFCGRCGHRVGDPVLGQPEPRSE